MNPVWITGLGAISPLGADRHACFAAALAADSAIRPASEHASAGLSGMLQAPAANPRLLLDSAYSGVDRATQFALVAAQEAMTDAASGGSELPQGERCGCYVGIGFGGATTLDAMYARYFALLAGDEDNRRRAAVVHPLSVPRMMTNAAGALAAARYGLRGACNTWSVACASSAIAAGEALRAIRHGYLDAALVIGAEAMLTPGSMVAWNALRVMARMDDAEPAASCRPFDRRRCGFVLGEGAAAVFLESAERARARGAQAHAELAGYGASNDAGHLTMPAQAGQVAAMRAALAEAGLEPGQVQYLNAHGTATEVGDVVESQAIAEVFGPAADALAISSTKSVHGHLIGAAGALELVLAIMVLESGSIPPTAHLREVDPRCTLDYVPLHARHGCSIAAVMSNSFAFGGSNACLVARRVGH